MTGLSVIERGAALLQTILVARALGITDYGVYGFLFGTIGFTASVMGLQMGLAAAVYLARYKEVDKVRARHVVEIVNKYAAVVVGIFLLASLPFSKSIAEWLLSSQKFQAAVLLGCVFIGSSIFSGVQDGIVQGFEDFKALSKVKMLVTFFTLCIVYPVATSYGLRGVILVMLGGTLLKYCLLNWIVRKRIREWGFPDRGSGVGLKDILLGFSIPSMLVSLATGFATWFGMYLLSKQQTGFEQIAIVNTGIQWRGPLLLISSSIGSVAIPAYSRYVAADDVYSAQRLKRIMLLGSAGLAFSVVLVIAVIAEMLLGLYGGEFVAGKLLFLLVIATSVPDVVVNVYLQKLAGSGRMWLQFGLYLPYIALLLTGYILFVPVYSGFGYAVTMMSASVLFCVYAIGYLEMTGRRLDGKHV